MTLLPIVVLVIATLVYFFPASLLSHLSRSAAVIAEEIKQHEIAVAELKAEASELARTHEAELAKLREVAP